MNTIDNIDLERKTLNNIKALAIDMITTANSGHPGIALSAAPIVYTIYKKHLIFDKKNPLWINRDRFVMSAGHGSSLLYANLFMSGFLELEDLKNFRKINSRTPGHPEISTPGVDAQTGPLGEGIATAVGIALAEKFLNNKYSYHKGKSLIDHYTYVLCSDGDLMEGISYEACSIAGNLNLGKLIVLYDSNNMTLDGSTNDTFKEKVLDRFKAMNFEVITVKDGNSIIEIDNAIKKAKRNKTKPTFIEIKTILGNGSKLQNSKEVHGKPLNLKDVEDLKEKLGIRNVMFTVYDDTINYMNLEQENRNNTALKNWNNSYKKYSSKLSSTDKNLLDKLIENDLSVDVSSMTFEKDDNLNDSGRNISNILLNKLITKDNLLMNGSADLFSSCKNYIYKMKDFNSISLDGRNIYFGVRENAMGAILNGLALSGIRSFGSTFLTFSDYMKPSIRMSSLMHLPVIYIFTHDNILISEDGPTHEPVEQLLSLRSIPNLNVYRPYDANEILGAYKSALKNVDGPSIIVLGKEVVDIQKETKINDVDKGGYFITNNDNSNGVIISSGMELKKAITVSNRLKEIGIITDVYSMPCLNKFLKENEKYQNELLKKNKKFVIEFGSPYMWYKFVKNDKYIISINTFGKSGSKEEIEKYFEIDDDSIYSKAKKIFK